MKWKMFFADSFEILYKHSVTNVETLCEGLIMLFLY